MKKDTCSCGYQAGDRMIVTGDSARFKHGLAAGAAVTLTSSGSWYQGEGWSTASGWQVACVDLEPEFIPASDDEVNAAIESILKGT